MSFCGYIFLFENGMQNILECIFFAYDVIKQLKRPSRSLKLMKFKTSVQLACIKRYSHNLFGTKRFIYSKVWYLGKNRKTRHCHFMTMMTMKFIDYICIWQYKKIPKISHVPSVTNSLNWMILSSASRLLFFSWLLNFQKLNVFISDYKFTLKFALK